MCFETVGQVTEVRADGTAVMDIGGRTLSVDLVVLVMDGVDVAPGDWLRTHTGLAVGRLSESEAAELVERRRAMQAAAPPDPTADARDDAPATTAGAS